MAKRRNSTDEFKAKVELLSYKTVEEISARHQLHPIKVSSRKRQAIDGMVDVFSGGKHLQKRPESLLNLRAPPPGALAQTNDDEYENKTRTLSL